MLLTLSGLTATASTLMQATVAHSCCDSGCDDPPKSGPCSSTPDCPCFSCLSMVMAPPLTVIRSSADEQLSFASTKRLQPSGYLPSIEYPPETV